MNKNTRRLNLKYRLDSNVEIHLSVDNKELFKIYKRYNLIDIVERNILFLKKEDLCKPSIIELLYNNGRFIGYSQEFLSNSKTFFEGINAQNFSIDMKYKAILDVFSMIRALHSKGIIIGDVHSRNMLYDEKGGYLIDLDEIRLKEEENYLFTEYYYVHYHIEDNYLKSSKNTDNIKASICALSLLYGFDFEEIAMMHSISMVVSYLELFINDKELMDDLKKIFYNDSVDIIYFDEILKKYFRGKEFIKTS